MAVQEIWDYLSTAASTADYTATELTVHPQRTLGERGEKNQVVHLGDDDSDEIVTLNSQSVFHVDLEWGVLSETDAGTIFDFYNDTGKGNGMARSFRWINYAETAQHTYTVRFASVVPRTARPASIFEVPRIKLKIIGRGT